MNKNDRLKIFRDSLGLSQKAFSEKYMCAQVSISKYETGIATIPDELEIQLARDGLNLHWLATGEGGMLLNTGSSYEIPLLTKEEVYLFDPQKEIPEPNAHSGEYPEHIHIKVPYRIREFGTDLRAMVVFDNQMSPILNAGDIAIFEATGWGVSGIYVYRFKDKVFIGPIEIDKNGEHILKRELHPGGVKAYEFEFRIIGRVRAVLKEV
jgi:transcriptional regulator with XRE-family HTH domain